MPETQLEIYKPVTKVLTLDTLILIALSKGYREDIFKVIQGDWNFDVTKKTFDAHMSQLRNNEIINSNGLTTEGSQKLSEYKERILKLFGFDKKSYKGDPKGGHKLVYSEAIILEALGHDLNRLCDISRWVEDHYFLLDSSTISEQLSKLGNVKQRLVKNTGIKGKPNFTLEESGKIARLRNRIFVGQLFEEDVSKDQAELKDLLSSSGSTSGSGRTVLTPNRFDDIGATKIPDDFDDSPDGFMMF